MVACTSLMASARSSSRAKILVADDSKFQRLLLEDTLKTEFEVILASDGLEAVELFLKEQPDLVVLDIIMPKMDGFEAGRRIQSETKGGYVPIVFVTEAASDENLLKFLDIGADDFIAKPFRPAFLMALFCVDAYSFLRAGL